MVAFQAAVTRATDLGEQFPFIVSELRAALHLPRKAVEVELRTAIVLFGRSPRLGAALRCRDLDRRWPTFAD